MRDENYYQRLAQIRSKYGYSDQANPEQNYQPINTYQAERRVNTTRTHYPQQAENYYQPEQLNKTLQRNILNTNDNLHNLQSKYGKKDFSHFDLKDKYSQGPYKNEISSPQKKQIYGSYNPSTFGREEVQKPNIYERPANTYEIKSQYKPAYQEDYHYKENDPYSSPIKKLGGEQMHGRSFQTFQKHPEERRISTTPTKYPVNSDYKPKTSSHPDSNNFRYDRTPESQFKEIQRVDEGYSRNRNNASPIKDSSSAISPNFSLTQKDNGDKFSCNISNIDKIQSKIQSILQKNK